LVSPSGCTAVLDGSINLGCQVAGTIANVTAATSLPPLNSRAKTIVVTITGTNSQVAAPSTLTANARYKSTIIYTATAAVTYLTPASASCTVARSEAQVQANAEYGINCTFPQQVSTSMQFRLLYSSKLVAAVGQVKVGGTVTSFTAGSLTLASVTYGSAVFANAASATTYQFLFNASNYRAVCGSCLSIQLQAIDSDGKVSQSGTISAPTLQTLSLSSTLTSSSRVTDTSTTFTMAIPSTVSGQAQATITFPSSVALSSAQFNSNPFSSGQTVPFTGSSLTLTNTNSKTIPASATGSIMVELLDSEGYSLAVVSYAASSAVASTPAALTSLVVNRTGSTSPLSDSGLSLNFSLPFSLPLSSSTLQLTLPPSLTISPSSLSCTQTHISCTTSVDGNKVTLAFAGCTAPCGVVPGRVVLAGVVNYRNLPGNVEVALLEGGLLAQAGALAPAPAILVP
jgi:hypothetical protein